VVAGEKPVEKSRSDVADVGLASRTWGVSNADLGGQR
jgi:hypothetical protein